MLKGAIDHSTPTTISGWIYSASRDVRNETVLAFVDGLCVGAGKVERFRQDLLDAGLGDGYLGFHFGITPPQPRDALRAYVKLDGSDLAIVPPGCKVVTADIAKPAVPRVTRSLASLEFMRQRGWLEQQEFDFLKFLNQFGIYDQSLRLTKKAAEAAGVAALDPETEAQRLFELLLLEPVKVESRSFESIAALAAAKRELAAGMVEPVVAIMAEKRVSLLLVEGSHLDDEVAEGLGLSGAIEYAIGPDRLVFLDLRARIGGKTGSESRIRGLTFGVYR